MRPAPLLPDEPTPVRLMNTIWADAGGVHDDLMTQAALRDWLIAVGYADADTPGEPGPHELTSARRLRDSLRRLAAFCTDDSRPAAQSPVRSVREAVQTVNAALTHLPRPQLAIRDEKLQRGNTPPTSATTAALAEIADDAIELLTGANATKLHACQASRCVLYFVKSHPRREWCSHACGNRVRAARHYQRIRAQHH